MTEFLEPFICKVCVKHFFTFLKGLLDDSMLDMMKSINNVIFIMLSNDSYNNQFAVTDFWMLPLIVQFHSCLSVEERIFTIT